MTQYLENVDIGSENTLGQSGMRRPYVKPFVRNLDVSVTETKSPNPSELALFSSNGGADQFLGPS
jgi:hypothetical protein